MEYIPFDEVNVGCMIKIMEYPCIVKYLTRISNIKHRIGGMDIFTRVIHSSIVDERDFMEVPFLIQKRWNVVNRDSVYLYLIDIKDRRERVKRPGYNLQDVLIEFVITVRYGNKFKVIKYECV
jgi:Zn-finger domain-containing protein